MAAVELDRLTKVYERGHAPAADAVSLRIGDGEFMVLLGPSGCGKTTTLRMVAGFELPSTGRIYLEGESVETVPPYKRNVNTVFQSYALFEHLSIADNVAFGLKRRKVPKDEIRTRVAEALELVQLTGREKARPDELSGGQKQRVALARALIREPPVLVLDDPLSAVDARTEAAILEAIERQARKRTVILITHRVAAAQRCDQVIVLERGQVIERGSHAELLEQGGVYALFAEEQQMEAELGVASVPAAELGDARGAEP
jgi:ABC-type Fe3+/spermidine/putrescine transport system ATPase subunit